jgi:protein arginine N-methyltransferase 1
VYSLDGYLQMIADRPRIEAYEEAIRRSVFPGATVADIGAGSGIMAMLACRHGAGHVWAIEPADVVELAREVVRANGMESRITFITKKSTEVELPHKADVMVSDLRGILPLHGDHIPSIVDARSRLLNAGGTQIPGKDVLHVAIARADELHPSSIVRRAREVSGVDLSPVLDVLTRNWTKAKRESLCLTSAPVQIAELDYGHVTSPDISASVELEIENEGRSHGLVVWFDTELVEGVAFSNAPDKPDLIYCRAFFPWPSPTELRSGDRVSLTIDARLVEGEYLWRWKTTIVGGTGSHVSFDQSNLGGSPLHASRLRRHASSYVASPWAGKEIEIEILRRIDGRRSNHDIAIEVADQCGGYEEAFRQVSTLVDLLEGRKT